MTPFGLALLIAALFSVIAIVLLSSHIMQLERRVASLERDRAETIVRWIEKRDRNAVKRA